MKNRLKERIMTEEYEIIDREDIIEELLKLLPIEDWIEDYYNEEISDVLGG